MKLIYIKLLVLVFLSFQIKAQNRYSFNVHKEFSLVLPGNIKYDSSYKEGKLVSEILLSKNFEAELMVFEGSLYEYLPELLTELNSSVETYGYKEIRKFSKGSLSNEINFEFLSGYSPDDKCNVIFGLIQDSFKRKQYEFTLYCYDLDEKAANDIIKSIRIN